MKFPALISAAAGLILTASAATVDDDMRFFRALNERDEARRGEALLVLAERGEYPAELALIHLTRTKLPPKSLERLLPVARFRFGELVPAVLLVRAFRAEESEDNPEPMPRGDLFNLAHTAWKKAAMRKLSPFEHRLFRELSGQLLELAWECGETAQLFPEVQKQIDSRGKQEWHKDFPIAKLLEFFCRHAFIAEGFELYAPEWDESKLPGRCAFAALLKESTKFQPRGEEAAASRIDFLLRIDQGDLAVRLAAERLEKTGDTALLGQRMNQLIYAMVASGRYEIFENVRQLIDPAQIPVLKAMTFVNGGKSREALELLPQIGDPRVRAELELKCRMALGEFDKAAALAKAADSPLAEEKRALALLTIAEARRDKACYDAAERIAGKKFDSDVTLSNAFGYVALVVGGDRDQAEKRICSALSKRPRESAYLDSMAWARYLAGDYAGAWKYMEDSLRYSSPSAESCEILGHAAAIRLALGDREGARRYGELALKLALEGEKHRSNGWTFRHYTENIRKILEQLK